MKDNTLRVVIGLLQDGTADKVVMKFLNVDEKVIIKAKEVMKKKQLLLTYEEFKELFKRVKATFSLVPTSKFTCTYRETEVFIASTDMDILNYFDRHSVGEMTDNGYLLKLKQT